MLYLHNDCTDTYRNMAFDEYCLEQLPLSEPVFWLWRNAPSVIIGLNQNAYTEVNIDYLKAHGIGLVRRVTGGGAVYHDLQNLNYTLVGRTTDMERDYPHYVGLMAEALKQMGVPATLSGRNDILVDGRKVSGYAKRVWKDRLMAHGTLMYNVDINTLTEVLNVKGEKLENHGIGSVRSRVANLKEYLPELDGVMALRSELRRILNHDGRDGELMLTAEQQAAIDQLADERFRTWEWNYGRSPEASIAHRKRFACGTVEAQVSVSHGCIDAVTFQGDFIGNEPAERLAAPLVGCRYDVPAIVERLENSHPAVGDCFDGLTAPELARLLIGAGTE